MPDPNDTPPLDAAYQLIVPADAEAVSVTVPVPQRESPVVPVIEGVTVTVAVTEVLDAVVQLLSVAST